MCVSITLLSFAARASLFTFRQQRDSPSIVSGDRDRLISTIAID